MNYVPLRFNPVQSDSSIRQVYLGKRFLGELFVENRLWRPSWFLRKRFGLGRDEGWCSLREAIDRLEAQGLRG